MTTTITILLFTLIIRLCCIVGFDGNTLKEQAFLQQTTNHTAKGYIYDRNYRVISDKDNTLSHVLGYSWDGGASGIEKAFIDNKLNQNREIIFKDALGEKIDYDTDYRGVRLTVDYNIQKLTEEVMDKNNLTGAAVIVDVKSGGILAMASAPTFDRNNIYKYLKSENGELINRALASYNVGSVFKIVTTAAALETKFSYEYIFRCEGETDIGDIKFICNKDGGHGVITFTEGFAHSCNCLFYNTGLNIGYQPIRKYAYDFGFGEEILRINGFLESRGNIPNNISLSDGDIANLSIGQGEILATPLQVADMMCTIANDGVRKQITLIDGIVDSNGNCNKLQSTEIGRIISVDTARNIKQMLKEAVQYGTGVNAKINGVETSGKTATAETGWQKNGETMTHGWFAGYFPSDEPRYACVVLCENGGYGSASAAPIFKEIGEKILDL